MWPARSATIDESQFTIPRVKYLLDGGFVNANRRSSITRTSELERFCVNLTNVTLLTGRGELTTVDPQLL